MPGLRFVDDREGVLLDTIYEAARRRLGTSEPPAFELAGPRERIYFDPAETSTGIVTCGGLCPGLNDVVRAIVMSLHHHYRGGVLPTVEIVKIHRRRNFVRLGPGLIGFPERGSHSLVGACPRTRARSSESEGVSMSPEASPGHPSGDNRFKLLDRAVATHHARGDALIEVLHAAQGIFGYLEDDVLIYVARALRRPLSQAYGVATFYNYFRLKPSGRHTVVLCLGTACYVKGAGGIQAALEKRCGCGFGQTTADGGVSLVSARCIGSCGLAPVAVVDDEVAPRLTVEEAVARVDAFVSGEPPATPVGRAASEVSP